MVIAPSTDALVRRGQLELSALASQRFILRERAQAPVWLWTSTSSGCGFIPRFGWSWAATRPSKAVAGGLGLGVISSHALHGRAREHGVSVLSVAGFPVPSQWHRAPGRTQLVSHRCGVQGAAAAADQGCGRGGVALGVHFAKATSNRACAKMPWGWRATSAPSERRSSASSPLGARTMV